ncbi:MAG: hypothetical protein JWM91_4698 [Rhodospirillales bacterium]|nr:hypothetical protein [Rhodospirillales bacterium]
MKMTMAAATAMMVLGCAQVALAQEGERGGLRSACRADFEQYCAGLPQGDGGRVQCLKDHKADLSEGCKGELMATSTAREACTLDAAKYCAESKPGGDRLKCMTANKDKLSEGCKSVLSGIAVGAD